MDSAGSLQHDNKGELRSLQHDNKGELQCGAEEWLTTLEKGCRRLQELVEALSVRSNEEPGIDGGAILLAGWLNDTAEDILDVMWELEEGPDPQLDAYIDWRWADDVMNTCKAFFVKGRDLRILLEARLASDVITLLSTSEAAATTTTAISTTTSRDRLEERRRCGERDVIDDNDDKDDGVKGSFEVNNDNNNKDNTNNNNNNGDADCGNCVVDCNNDAVDDVINNNIDNNIIDGYKNSNSDNDNKNNSDNDNNNDNNNDSNNNNNNDDEGVDDQGSSGVGDGIHASEIIISVTGLMLKADGVGYGLDKVMWLSTAPPPNLDTELVRVIRQRVGVG
ncbi:hypothetical protein CBR_g30559 [Chara braunii]|uniref:Uncharacterized protein n=1 Tax=Chara braunii TaxID=69332 RepID=A0A388LDB1_CHABU|nr:hypothetical protein CBR_g30559 [Chara braunii]|eukprot:GBG80193.1 hypothetical protein CBR_g30559 [Chara braunii]